MLPYHLATSARCKPEIEICRATDDLQDRATFNIFVAILVFVEERTDISTKILYSMLYLSTARDLTNFHD
jgi:hypothetical protein